MRVLYYNDEDFNLKLNKSSNQIEGDFFNSEFCRRTFLADNPFSPKKEVYCS